MFRSHQQLEGGMRIDKLREMPHWSYSAMQCYITCPLKYKFRYIDNAEPERTGSCFPFGRAFHAALSERARIGKDMSEREVCDVFEVATFPRLATPNGCRDCKLRLCRFERQG